MKTGNSVKNQENRGGPIIKLHVISTRSTVNYIMVSAHPISNAVYAITAEMKPSDEQIVK